MDLPRPEKPPASTHWLSEISNPTSFRHLQTPQRTQPDIHFCVLIKGVWSDFIALPNLFIKLPTYFSQGKEKKKSQKKKYLSLTLTSLCKQRIFLSMLLQIHKEKKIGNKIHSTKKPGSMNWKENLWTGCAAERRLHKARLTGWHGSEK